MFMLLVVRVIMIMSVVVLGEDDVMGVSVAVMIQGECCLELVRLRQDARRLEELALAFKGEALPRAIVADRLDRKRLIGRRRKVATVRSLEVDAKLRRRAVFEDGERDHAVAGVDEFGFIMGMSAVSMRAVLSRERHASERPRALPRVASGTRRRSSTTR